MRRADWPMLSHRFGGIHWLLVSLLAALAAPGCHSKAQIPITTVSKPPTVNVIRPQVRNIIRMVDQPSFLEAYERTSIYPKVSAYIKEWKVDIGDKVKKDQVLATLVVPELLEDYATKKANVELGKQRIDLARETVEVAEADVKTAKSRVIEAREALDKFQAEVDRWDTEVKRLRDEDNKGVVDSKILVKSNHQWKSSIAARDAAKAIIRTAQAELLTKNATRSKAKADVVVTEADLKVAESEEKRLKAWVGYLTLFAPFDGVIVSRNANTLDFVLPSTGDPTANNRAPHRSPSGSATPIYVVDRTDIVRIFVDVPEQVANYVQIGNKASVLIKAFRDQSIPTTVTRTSWALNTKSRTLRAEIDLPNPGNQLMPGMFANAKVIIERHSVRALPVVALDYSGDESVCWEYQDGHAMRTEIQTGVSDGEWIEVINRRVPTSRVTSDSEEPWVPIDGSEQVILGELASLTEGGPVQRISETAGSKNGPQ